MGSLTGECLAALCCYCCFIYAFKLFLKVDMYNCTIYKGIGIHVHVVIVIVYKVHITMWILSDFVLQ